MVGSMLMVFQRYYDGQEGACGCGSSSGLDTWQVSIAGHYDRITLTCQTARHLNWRLHRRWLSGALRHRRLLLVRRRLR
jgi:hypothetical protein